MNTHNMYFYREIKTLPQNYDQILILNKSSDNTKAKLETVSLTKL